MTVETRHILLEGASNLRDIGGYEAADGRRIRWGVVYRSGAMFRLTDADWEWMRARNIGAICDLRSAEERVLAPTHWQGGPNTRHVGIAYDAEILFGRLARERRRVDIGEMGNSLYREFPKLLAPSFRRMFQTLLDGHMPLIVHCTAGQDRTGLAIGLLLSALGIPRPVIFEDYQLSTKLRRIENEIDREAMLELTDDNLVARFYADLLKQRGVGAFQPRPLVNGQGEALLSDAFAAIETEWGSIAAYLDQMLGVGADDIGRLQSIFLADA